MVETAQQNKKKKKKKGLELHNKNESKNETTLKQIIQEAVKLGDPTKPKRSEFSLKDLNPS